MVDAGESAQDAAREAGPSAGEAAYVDTPNGIFTASGLWFRTTETALRAYAAEVLDRVPLRVVLAHAGRWLRSPQTLTLWALPALLTALPPLQAAAIALGVYLVWAALGPYVVGYAVSSVLRVLESVVLQAFYYTIVMSGLALLEQWGALAVGLGGFILLRWGLVERLCRPLLAPVLRRLYNLPVPDHVLRSMIVRTALRHRVSMPEVDRIERHVLDQLQKKKSPKKPPKKPRP